MKYIYLFFIISLIDAIVFITVFNQYTIPAVGIGNFILYGGIGSAIALSNSQVLFPIVAICAIVTWFVRTMLVYTVARGLSDLSPFK